jgi:hypothetical protein
MRELWCVSARARLRVYAVSPQHSIARVAGALD